MEKSIKRLAFFIAALFFSSFAFTQEMPSQEDQIRIQVWSDLDPFPGRLEEGELLVEEFENPISREETSLSEENYLHFSYAINRIRELSPYLMEGMLYGWNFEYVPSDKTRKVEEFFELSTIAAFDSEKNHITYHNPTFDEGKVSVWIWCDRTYDQKQIYKQWKSITYPKIKGTGTAPVSLGKMGIKEAISQSVKAGVRDYWRKFEKNKPKEIIGKIFVVGWPRIYVKQGQYIVELDFFMETVRMSKYSTY